MWSSGETVTYTNWHPGEPNAAYAGEDYAHITAQYGNGEWTDRRDYDGNYLYGVVEFETGQVATEITAWGGIKALYRK